MARFWARFKLYIILGSAILIAIIALVFTTKNALLRKKLARQIRAVRDQLVEANDEAVDSGLDALERAEEAVIASREATAAEEARHDEAVETINAEIEARAEELSTNAPDELTRELARAFNFEVR